MEPCGHVWKSPIPTVSVHTPRHRQKTRKSKGNLPQHWQREELHYTDTFRCDFHFLFVSLSNSGYACGQYGPARRKAIWQTHVIGSRSVTIAPVIPTRPRSVQQDGSSRETTSQPSVQSQFTIACGSPLRKRND